MHTELDLFKRRLDTLSTPEELFGPLSGTPDRQVIRLKQLYRKFATLTHEDRHDPADKPMARDAFVKLTALFHQAAEKISHGRYGQTTVLATIKSRTATYSVESVLAGGDLATVYRAHDGKQAVLLKVARAPAFNDLLQHEAEVLKELAGHGKDTSFLRYIPEHRESLRIGGGARADLRAVNVLSWSDGYVPLTRLFAEYPEGVHSRHGVWIFNRLLTVLGFAHSANLLHGAVLPPHVLINPANHGLMLVDWAYAVPIGQRVTALSENYRAWYPAEVPARRTATAGTDLYMAALCVIYVLGGDFGEVPASVPLRIARFLSSCLLINPARRPQDAFALYDAFKTLTFEVYGPSRFVPLELSV